MERIAAWWRSLENRQVSKLLGGTALIVAVAVAVAVAVTWCRARDGDPCRDIGFYTKAALKILLAML